MVGNDAQPVMPKGRGHKTKTGKVSRVVSIRLNSTVEAQNDALEVLQHYEAQGQSTREIVTNALIYYGYDSPKVYNDESPMLLFIKQMMSNDSDFWRQLSQTVIKAIKEIQPDVLRQYAISDNDDSPLAAIGDIPLEFANNLRDMRQAQRFTRGDSNG